MRLPSAYVQLGAASRSPPHLHLTAVGLYRIPSLFEGDFLPSRADPYQFTWLHSVLMFGQGSWDFSNKTLASGLRFVSNGTPFRLSARPFIENGQIG